MSSTDPVEPSNSSILIDHSLSSHDGEMDHPDERWLVSYADMMTLLFGLFVMLYSMANKFEQVQKSATKEFTKNEKTESDKQIVEIGKNELEQLRSAASANIGTIEELKSNAKHLEAENLSLKAEHEATLVQMSQLEKRLSSESLATAAIKRQLAQNVDQNPTLEQLNEKNHALVEENKTLAAQLKQASLINAKSQASTKALKATLQKQDSQEALQTELTELKAENETLRSEVSKQSEKIDSLEKIARKHAKANGAFAAVVITWPTQNHDIDLIVTDPEGKAYSYKHRSFDSHPGKFVLDTRRGPGAEMWQTDRLLPGTYLIKYVFYNTYGNNETAPVSGSIYSEKGITELPKVNLDFNGKREVLFKMKISDDGEVIVNH
jgi:flagellar motor protein MotB